MILDKIKAYGFMVGCIALAGLLAVQTLRLHSEQRATDRAMTTLANERAAWAHERANAADALARATTQAREKEQALAAAAHQSEETKNAEIATLAARAADLRRRLRNAEANAATSRLVSGAAAAPAPGDPSGLRDGAVIPERVGDGLVGLAERAEAVRLQLAACTRQYNAAREALR